MDEPSAHDGPTSQAGEGPAEAPRPAPRFVPETRPTPLQPYFIGLSVVGLLCGAIAITALDLGAGLDSLVVRAPVLVGGASLALTMADALVRVWRAAWAWMPVDRGKGLFRLAWVAAILGLYAALIVVVWAVLGA